MQAKQNFCIIPITQLVTFVNSVIILIINWYSWKSEGNFMIFFFFVQVLALMHRLGIQLPALPAPQPATRTGETPQVSFSFSEPSGSEKTESSSPEYTSR